MPRRILLMCVLVGPVFSCGCRQDTNPPPRFNKPMSVDGQVLMPPPPLTHRADESLLQSIATGEAPAARIERREEAVSLDTSTARAAAQSFADLAGAQQVDQLPELLVPEQQEAVREVLTIVQPFAEAARDLQAALDQSFSTHAIQLPPVGPVDQLTSRFTVENVSVINDDEAEATLLVVLPNQEEKQQSFTLRRMESGWRIELPGFQQPPDMEAFAEQFRARSEGLRNLAARVQRGEFTDETAVKAEIDKVMAGTYEAPQAELEPPPDNQAEPQPEPYRQPRQRDAVDDTIAVPGVLNRG